jgi:hypothetical protein
MLARHIAVSAAIVIIGVATIGATMPDQATREKPNRGILYADYGPDPASFDELWRASDLVVRGSVQATTVRRSNASKRAVPVTLHRLQVLEVLKSSGASDARQTISLVQMAGSLDIDGMQVTVDPGSMPILAPKQEVLAFLKTDPQGLGFSIAFGPAGLYVVSQENVTIPREASALLPLFHGQSTVRRADFMAAMKARAASQKGAGQ